MENALGIIGGSGLYQLPGLEEIEELQVDTPFGAPSGPILRGRLDGRSLYFLARHGPQHTLLPSEIPFRANLWALKALGCSYAVSVSAVGSLQDHLAPGHVVVVDQFVDRTKNRPRTFFGDGIVAHVAMAEPVSAKLAAAVADAVAHCGGTVHRGGTYICIEGPTFGTRADSELYRSWGMDVVGMTNWPEAALARECEIAYATMAMVTDYDCWKTDETVTVEAVIAQLQANADLATETVAHLARTFALDESDPTCHDALAVAILTPHDAISDAARSRLEPLLRRYLP